MFRILTCVFVGLGISNTVGLSFGSGVGILSGFFPWHKLPLKLLRTVSLASKNNPKFFGKKFFD